jgi:flagellar hook-associated protein FlgK
MTNKTKRNTGRNQRKTRRVRGGERGGLMEKESASNSRKSYIVKMFLELLTMVKLYHWKTKSYAQHKATDELYSKLNENIDTFVEILLGKDESRIKMVEKKLRLLDMENLSDFKSRIYEYRNFLVKMSTYFNGKKDSDLLNVRDEILGDLNQFLYLLTFDK